MLFYCSHRDRKSRSKSKGRDSNTPDRKYGEGAIRVKDEPLDKVGCCYHLSRLVGKPTMWFPNRSDTNRPVQAQERARSLKFRI